jgi:hypothetical protein
MIDVDSVAIACVGVGQQRKGAARDQARDRGQVQLEPYQTYITVAQEGLT